MALRDTYTYVIDLATDSAQTSIKKFKSEVASAEGPLNKFKVAGTQGMALVKQHAGELALLGGAALVAFGAASVKAFTDGALAAGKFADATGVTNEEASRLIEVAGDVGISADTMQTALIRLEKAVAANSPAFKNLGVDIAYAKDGTVDANATFLNAIETLNGIPDPAKRAEAASTLFGKGFAGAAEIVTADAEDMRKALEAVSDAQVFDDNEVKKAREFRASMDDLNDKLEQVKMTIGGGLVPVLSDAADQITAIADAVEQIPGPVKDVAKEVADFALAVSSPLSMAMKFAEAVRGDVVFSLNEFTGTSEELRAELEALGTKEGDIITMLALHAAKQAEVAAEQGEATEATDLYTQATDQNAAAVQKSIHELNSAEAMLEGKAEADEVAADAADEHTEELERQAEAAKELADEIDDLYSANLRLVGGDIAVRESQRQATQAVKDYTTAVDEGNISTDEMSALQDQTAASLLSAASAAAENEIATARASGATVTAAGETAIMREKLQELAAYLGPGPLRDQIDGYISKLGEVPSDVNSAIHADIDEASISEAERVLEYLRRTRTARIVASLANPGNIRGNQIIPEEERESGGPIPGAPGQPVPIMAHGGEFVLSADVVNAVKRGGTTKGLGATGGSPSASTGGNTYHHYTIQIDGNVNDDRSLQVLERRLEEIERRKRGQA